MKLKNTAMLALATITTLTICTSAQAVTIPIENSAPAQSQQEEDSCDGSTMEMHECIGVKLAVADKELNTFYRAIRAQLAKTAKGRDVDAKKSALEIDARLVASQRAWVAFRDADCLLQGVDMLGGSGEGLVIHGCTLTKTRERVKQLKEYAF
jgi:uncharacterized protein YecT (DUF1311 family)